MRLNFVQIWLLMCQTKSRSLSPKQIPISEFQKASTISNVPRLIIYLTVNNRMGIFNKLQTFAPLSLIL